jgi:4-hydroxybenzoate polyprenyltransferase/phosphoserine phosphatase
LDSLDINTPLIVDLDGTLIKTDTLLESVVKLLVKNPLLLFSLPVWMMAGKAHLKKKIAEKVKLSFKFMPFNLGFVDFLRSEKNKGRKIILATGAHQSIANEVARELELFDDAFGSDEINLTGKNKADFLVKNYGSHCFDYAGDSRKDLHVWSVSRVAIAVNSSSDVVKKLKSLGPENLNLEFSISEVPRSHKIKVLFSAMRVKQWIKNVLIFVPLLLSQSYTSLDQVIFSVIAFFAFSSCASSVYLLNDLVDLDSDRQHRYKKFRPFASGELNILYGTLLAIALLIIGFTAAFLLNFIFFKVVVSYYLVTVSYSFMLKKLVLVDVFTLAALYSFRLVAGGTAIDISLSNWILMFSFFIFLSLGSLKRFIDADLDKLATMDRRDLISHGRGYVVADLTPLMVLGVSSGLISVLVFLLYISDSVVVDQYRSPEFLWITAIALAYWISNLWLLAGRNVISEDPISFALKERHSVSSVFIIISLVLLAIFV